MKTKFLLLTISPLSRVQNDTESPTLFCILGVKCCVKYHYQTQSLSKLGCYVRGLELRITSKRGVFKIKMNFIL